MVHLLQVGLEAQDCLSIPALQTPCQLLDLCVELYQDKAVLHSTWLASGGVPEADIETGILTEPLI